MIARSAKRMAVLVVGLAVTAAGIAMLALPGPGIVVIIIGLAILATEFAWAEHLLDKAKEQAEKAAKTAKKGLFRRWRKVEVDVDVAVDAEHDAVAVTETVRTTETVEPLDPEESGVVKNFPR